MYGRHKGEPYEKIIPYHRCLAEDFDKFAAPSPEAEGMLESMKKEGEERGLYCLDAEVADQMSVWSVTDDDDY